MTPVDHLQTTCAALDAAAFAYAKAKNGTTWSALCAAAETFAKARWAVKAPPKAGPKRSGFTMPFGKTKGVAIEDLDLRDLKFLLKVLPESIADPNKSQWSAKNQDLLEAVEAELAAR